MVSFRPALIVIFFLSLGFSTPTGASQPDRLPRIRPQDNDVRRILETGVRESPTFREFVNRINESDVVVFIQSSWLLPKGTSGRLTFIGTWGGFRYVVVSLTPDEFPERRIATLGHELQHVVEVTEDPSITDPASLALAYQRVGRRLPSQFGKVFDTDEAVTAGGQVWREVMRGNRAE